MTTTVGTLFNIIAIRLQENSNWFAEQFYRSSGGWTQEDILRFMTEAQRDFLADTGLVKNIAYVAAVTNQVEYSEPAQSMDVERISWNGKQMYPVSQFDLDMMNWKWREQRSRQVRYYHRDNLGTKRFAVNPAPNTSGLGWSSSGGPYGVVRGISGSPAWTASGSVGVIRNMRGTRNYFPGAQVGQMGYRLRGTLRQAATATTNFMVMHDVIPPALQFMDQVLVVPDAFARYVVYGALAKAWAKEGDGQDLARSQYCKARFERGILLAKRLMAADMLGVETK